MVYLAFYKAKYGDWKDKLISYWTFGPYSHCELVVNPKTNLCYSCSPREGIVRYKEIDLYNGHWDCISTGQDFTSDFKKLCDNELNKTYDWFGIIFSQILPFNKHRPNQWFCSELCAYLLGLRNPYIYDPNELYRLYYYISNFRRE